MPATLPISTENVTSAVVAMLTTVTGKPFGDGDAPPEPPDVYGIVDVIPGGGRYGDAVNPHTDIELVIQITAVGTTRRQAAWLRDRADQALLRKTAAGYVNAIDAYDLNGVTKSLATEASLQIVDRWWDSSGGIDREDIVHNAHERYVLWVSPIS